jgi:hypothetical protein
LASCTCPYPSRLRRENAEIQQDLRQRRPSQVKPVLLHLTNHRVVASPTGPPREGRPLRGAAGHLIVGDDARDAHPSNLALYATFLVLGRAIPWIWHP